MDECWERTGKAPIRPRWLETSKAEETKQECGSRLVAEEVKRDNRESSIQIPTAANNRRSIGESSNQPSMHAHIQTHTAQPSIVWGVLRIRSAVLHKRPAIGHLMVVPRR